MRRNKSILIRFFINFNSCFTETHLKKHIATSNMKHFVALIGDFHPLTNVTKESIPGFDGALDPSLEHHSVF